MSIYDEWYHNHWQAQAAEIAKKHKRVVFLVMFRYCTDYGDHDLTLEESYTSLEEAEKSLAWHKQHEDYRRVTNWEIVPIALDDKFIPPEDAALKAAGMEEAKP